MTNGPSYLAILLPTTDDSVYFAVNILLEALTFTLGSLVSAIVTYWMVGYANFTHPHSVMMNFFTYTLLLILHANVAGSVVHMCAVMCPNADIAFAMVGGEFFPCRLSILSEFHPAFSGLPTYRL